MLHGEVNVTISGTVDDKNLGEYQVEYSAVDSSGNEAKAGSELLKLYLQES